MFHCVASPDWTPGRPLAPAGCLLFRSRAEAAQFAPGLAVVAVAVRFDGRRGLVRPRGSVGSETAGSWSARAVENALGGLTVFEAIPATLVRPSAESEPPTEVQPRVGDGSPVPGFGGWDSLTVALLA
jgi:hypothetical protein